MWKVLRFVEGYEVEKEEEESIRKVLQVSEINITEGRIDFQSCYKEGRINSYSC